MKTMSAALARQTTTPAVVAPRAAARAGRNTVITSAAKTSAQKVRENKKRKNKIACGREGPGRDGRCECARA